MTLTLEQIALGLGIVGFACFAWPIVQRMNGKAEPEAPAAARACARRYGGWASS